MESYVCKICRKVFLTEYALKQHYDSHTGYYTPTPEEDDAPTFTPTIDDDTTSFGGGSDDSGSFGGGDFSGGGASSDW